MRAAHVRKAGVAMILEILGALAALATIGSFVVDMAVLLYRFVRRKRTHKRMVREEVGTTTSENKQGRA